MWPVERVSSQQVRKFMGEKAINSVNIRCCVRRTVQRLQPTQIESDVPALGDESIITADVSEDDHYDAGGVYLHKWGT